MASKAVVLGAKAYASLLGDVRGLLAQGQARAEAEVAVVLAQTYWAVGQRVVGEGLSERAGYGDAVLEQLSEALGIQLRTLQQSVLFAREYPKRPRAKLSWSHFRELLRVKDHGARARYERRALEESWSVRKLGEAIRTRALLAEASEAAVGASSSEGKGGRRGVRKRAVQLERPRDARYVYAVEVVRAGPRHPKVKAHHAARAQRPSEHAARTRGTVCCAEHAATTPGSAWPIVTMSVREPNHSAAAIRRAHPTGREQCARHCPMV